MRLIADQVILNGGETVQVYPVPPFALAEIERRYTPTASGDAVEERAAQASREKLVREAAWLMALPAVVAPDDWQFPRGLIYAGIAPREGDTGRLLDYIEYGLLTTPADIQAVQAVMYGADVPESDVQVAEAAFPVDSGRTPPFGYPVAAG